MPMPMNVLEVAIYAMVLSASQPAAFDCVAVRPEGVNCTNGLAAREDGPGVLAFSSGVRVLKDRDGRVHLSDGTQTFFDASAWVTFKDADGRTVVSVRKTGTFRFRFSNGYTCEIIGQDHGIAHCRRS